MNFFDLRVLFKIVWEFMCPAFMMALYCLKNSTNIMFYCWNSLIMSKISTLNVTLLFSYKNININSYLVAIRLLLVSIKQTG